MNNNDNLKSLYNTLQKEGYTPPAFEQFAKDMEDDNNLRGVYSTLQKEGYTPPDYDTFRNDMGFGNDNPIDLSAATEGVGVGAEAVDNVINKNAPTSGFAGIHAQQVVDEYDRSAGNMPGNAQITTNEKQPQKGEVQRGTQQTLQQPRPVAGQAQKQGVRMQFVPEYSNVKGFTVAKDSPLRQQYPFLNQLGENEQAFFRTDTNEPLYSWKDRQGREITPEEAALLNQRAEIEQNEAVRPYQVPLTSLQLPEVKTRGIRTDTSITSYVDAELQREHGKDYLNKEITLTNGKKISGSEMLSNVSQQIYSNLNKQINEARITYASADEADKKLIIKQFADNYKGLLSEATVKRALEEHNALQDAEKESEERMRAEWKQMQKDNPGFWKTLKNSVGSGFVRLGAGLLDTMQQLASGMLIEDPSRKEGYFRTRSYEEALADMNDPLTIATRALHDKADRLSKSAQPYKGKKSFLDMLWDGEITQFLQKGVATAGESLPMTLSAFNPFTMTLNAISMAGSNFRQNTLENPNIPVWKRAAQAIGSAAIEQAVERYADPIFKYIGGRNILKGVSKENSERIVNEITEDATNILAERIYGRLRNITKDAAGEGAEEVVANVGNDALGETLDLISGDTDYGLRAQWEKYKEENPTSGLRDFAKEKAKENIESFIGGAMAGAYTSTTTQLSVKALQYSFDKIGGERNVTNHTRLNPVQVDIAQSYDDGYNFKDDNELQNTKSSYEQQRLNIENIFSQEQVETIDKDPVTELSNIKDLSAEKRQAVVDYVNAKAKYDGMMQRLHDDEENGIDHRNLHVDDGMIHTALLYPTAENDGELQEVFITRGNIVMRDDGTVDTEASSNEIYYKSSDGQTHIASPDKFQSVNEPISVEEYANANAELTMNNEKLNIGNEEEQYAVGDEVNVNIDGNNYTATVQGDDGNGNVSVYYQNADGIDVPATFTVEELRNMNKPNVELPNVFADDFTENVAENGGISTENGNNDAENIPQNGNIESQNIPASAETLQADGETLQAGTGGASALERIPKDEQGQPLYEQADPETAWDALLEQTNGNEAIAQEVADDMVADKEAAVKKQEKQKPKSGTTPAEKIAARLEQNRIVEQAKAELMQWQKIAQTPQRRKQAALADQSKAAEEAARLRWAEEEKLRAEREEAERIRREVLKGVPDFVDDTPQDARARGYRRVNGEKVDRQQSIPTRQGKEVQVKFDDKNIPTGHVALIDASQLQPSHINGQRNPLHFIDEAQPKERNDNASVMSARKIAANIRPEEITSSVTAYTGAPTVNTRGEVIQGNNRSAALREMWAGEPEQAAIYKQYLTGHAADFGLTPEDVEAMQQPVLVNMLDVPDEDAITLGQFVASDTESGGTERIKPKNIVQKMGGDMRSFAGRLLASPDEEMSFAELVDRNGMDVLRWMQQKGYITPTQYKNAFDSRDNLTAEAKNDLKGVMYQSIFQNGNTHLEEMFNALPSKAQKAILATAYRDYDSPNAERMIEEIQDSISAYYALSQDPAFAGAKNYKEARIAAESWKRQYAFDDVTGESYLPSEKYSNFALLLATMYKGQTQTFIQNTFNHIFDLVQGTQEATFFEEPDNTPRSLVEAINETLSNLREELLLNGDFIYNRQRRNNVLAGSGTTGQPRGQGSDGSSQTGRRAEDGTEASNGADRVANDKSSGRSERNGGENQGRTEKEKSTEERLSREEAAEIIANMEEHAEVAPEVELTIENWDSQIPTGTRKTGYIMTGNILQAIADTQDERGGFPGQLISYTDIDGNVHDGILMPDKWNRSMLKTSGAPIISRLKQIKDYMSVASHDGKVEITGNSWAKMYYLTVPKTKKDGAVYYENKTLLRAVNGGNFYPYRGKLRADIPSENIETVVRELSKLGVKVKEDFNDDDVLYRNASEELNEVNGRFNEELTGLTEENADKVVFSLGRPSTILRAAGVEDKPMKLYGNKVIKKMKKHGFKLGELHNLPEAVANPIAVFKNYGKEGNRSILTELKTEQGNFLVTLTLGEGHDVDFNVVTSVFGKGGSNIVDWIKRGFSTYINKEKALNYLHHSALKAVTSDNQELVSAANIVQNFENPNISDENQRLGNGSLTDDDLSYENDPVAKMTGRSSRTAAQRRAFAERERQHMVQRVQELAETLHLDNVDIVTDASTLHGNRAKAKGFFSHSTGRITIVIPNHTSVFDAEQTLLHEAVVHYGLRELFGEHFDTFLDNVYENAEEGIRKRINQIEERLYQRDIEERTKQKGSSVFARAEAVTEANEKRRNGDYRKTATEEYLASLAENTNFENVNASWWSKIKELFLRMLHKIGFEDFSGVTLSDNELRYILWRSYENLAEPGRYRSIIGEVRDIAKQHELNVGNYKTANSSVPNVADKANEPDVPNTPKLDEENRRFNEELDVLTEENADKVALSLGRPSAILRAAGVEDKSMKLYGNKVIKKMKKHGFMLDELRNLPKAVADPIAVFNNYQRDGNRSILTELRTSNGNFLVTVDLGKDADIDFNIVTSVFGKGDNNIIYWINKGYATYINKEKAQEFLFHQSAPIAATAANSELISAANVVKNFENPSVESENVDEDILYRMAEDAENDLRKNWQEEYDRRTTGAGFNFTEASQDDMRSVKMLQKTVAEETGRPITANEDADALQNRLSSTNHIEEGYYEYNYFRPIIKAVANLVKMGASYNDKGRDIIKADKDVLKYIIAKSGLERNAKFRERDAEAELQRIISPMEDKINNGFMDKDEREAMRKRVELEKAKYNGVKETLGEENANKWYDKERKELDTLKANNNIKIKDYDKRVAKLDTEYNYGWKTTFNRDYSGLTELFGKDDFDAKAQEYVERFEGDFKDLTGELWKTINNATKATLRKAYESGLISRKQYEDTRDMFNYYVPLRSWSNDSASEMYNYRKDDSGRPGKLLKHAFGRTSLADNPLAMIATMAQSTIMQGNKNKVKQRLYNLAVSRNTSLLSVDRQWYENKGTDDNPKWERAYPELNGEMGAEEVAAALENFEQRMQQLKEQGRARRNRQGLTLAYHTTRNESLQHRVSVSIGGREYNIYVNGNPRAAQALNGELRDDESKGVIAAVHRWLSKVYTSHNPEFTVGNYQRDSGLAAAIVAATEDKDYQLPWAKNMALFNPFTSGLYLNALINGTIKGKNDLGTAYNAISNGINKTLKNGTVEQYMHEFLFNGGETGFTNVLTVDQYKKKMRRDIKDINTMITPRKAQKAVSAWMERCNRVFEDATRFATYVTSREQGRDVNRSIRDAKEISLNFNTRGADGLKNDSIFHKFFRGLRRLYIFTNPNIQALEKVGRAFATNPKRSALYLAGIPVLLGYSIAKLIQVGLDGDDDDERVKAYKDLPEWIRRSNICIPVGGTKFVTVPLSYELRISYGLGEMLWEMEQGDITPDKAALEIATQLSDLLPVSLASGSVYHNLAPSGLAPIVDVAINENYMGIPIWSENGFNENMPAYSKAFAGTEKWLVKSAEVANSLIPDPRLKDSPTPDKYTPGLFNVNPGMIEHLLDNYFGGWFTFPMKAKRFVQGYMLGDEDVKDIRNIPFVSRNLKDSKTGSMLNRSQGDRYWIYMNEYELNDQRRRGYTKEAEHGVPEFIKKVTELYDSPGGQRMMIIKGYKKTFDKIDRRISEIDEFGSPDGKDKAEREELKNASDSLKSEMVDILDGITNGTIMFKEGKIVRMPEPFENN